MQRLLNDILTGINFQLISGKENIEITGISFDSRKTEKGHLFIAVKGLQTDGHTFIDAAVEKGAVAVLCEKRIVCKAGTVLYTENTSGILGKVASNFYENPSSKLKLIGVTGTNGKTTTATLLYKLFRSIGKKAGLISTVANYINDQEYKAEYTTPDALSFNELLFEMVQSECEFCFAEVSSHAIVQNRINGLKFFGGIFTNITHDHLDYHKTFADYIQAKKHFFDHLPDDAFVLINTDDKNASVMIQNTKAKISTYALKSFADYKSKIIERHIDSMLLSINGVEFWTLLTGTFNAYNITAVYAAALLSEFNQEQILQHLSTLTSVRGRFETLNINGITAIIDYAHTPDALKNVLKTINEIRDKKTKLITVIGAGGNRDKTKRPIMAQIAETESDRVILTSDNPRFENPEDIINQMYEGITDKKRVLKIANREEAVKTAIFTASEGDIILIAGKGHETYQEINGVRHHLDDKEIAETALNLLNN